MKRAQILSSLVSITPFKMFNWKPRIISAISRKYPCSSQSICNRKMKIHWWIAKTESRLEEAFLFAFLYLYEHLARWVVLNYNGANHRLTSHFKCPCRTTASPTHAVVFKNHSILLAYQLQNPHKNCFALENDIQALILCLLNLVHVNQSTK